jgi:hypothetical protein
MPATAVFWFILHHLKGLAKAQSRLSCIVSADVKSVCNKETQPLHYMVVADIVIGILKRSCGSGLGFKDEI